MARLRDLAGRFASLRDSEAMFLAKLRISTVALRALNIAQSHAPHDTGAFAAGLALVPYGEYGFAIVSDNPELLEWLRSGTGIYAGKGRIYPVNARALVFESWARARMAPNFRGAYAFASIAGMQANPWEQGVLEEISFDLEGELPRLAYDFVAFLGYGEVR